MAITTIYTYPLDGSQREFIIPFEYLARRFVVLTLIGTDRKELVLTTDYRFISKTAVQTTVAWGPGDGYERIEVRRNTSATERLVDFADGSILRASELNTSQVQTLHVAEEARNMVADTIATNQDGDLDARGRRLVNLADAQMPDHAVTLRQEQAWAQSTLNNKNASEAANIAAQQAKVGSESARDRAITAEGTSGAHSANAKTEADRSKTEADRSALAASTIGDNVQLAQAAASTATDQKAQAVLAREGAEAAKGQAEALAGAATDAVSTVRSGAWQLGMGTWGYRGNPWAGFAPDDGQELSRELYPDFAAALDAGHFPVTDEATWQANPLMRGCFVANSSDGMFRMRDINGVSSGSVGALFLRGDGLMSAGTPGLIQMDEFRSHKHDVGYTSFIHSNIGPNPNMDGNGVHGYAKTEATGGNETRPMNVSLCRMTRLYGTIGVLGAADAAALADSYASMASRVSVLESRLTVRKWTSGLINLSTTGQTIQHGLGAVPDNWRLYFKFKVDFVGYKAGELVPVVDQVDYNGSTTNYGTQLWGFTDTTFKIATANGGGLVLSTVNVQAAGFTAAQGSYVVSLFSFA